MRRPSPWLDELVTTYWRRRPGVFAQAARARIDDAAVLGALRNLERAPNVRVTRTSVPIAPPAALRPGREGTLVSYLRRLERALGAEYAVVVNGVQALDPSLWRSATSFASMLYRATGFPVGGALMDLFISRFGSGGVFGVHRDAQDVFTIVLAGRKRFLLWHERDLRPLVERSRSLRFSGNQVVGPITARLRSSAVSLVAEVGDVVYWPAEYWHVGDGDGTSCASLGLGLFWGDARSLLGVLAPVDERSPTATANGPDDHLADLSGWARTHLSPGSAAWTRLEERMAQQVSRCGFFDAPDPAALHALRDEEVVRGAHHETLCVMRRRDDVYWSVRGHGQSTPPGRAVDALFDFVRSGERERVGTLLRRWDGRRGGGRSRDEELRQILRTLARHGVLLQGVA